MDKDLIQSPDKEKAVDSLSLAGDIERPLLWIPFIEREKNTKNRDPLELHIHLSDESELILNLAGQVRTCGKDSCQEED